MPISKVIDATKGQEVPAGKWISGGDCIKTVAGAKRSAKANLEGFNDDGNDYIVVIHDSLVSGRFEWVFGKKDRVTRGIKE